jgi:hypothetical protein
MGTGVGTAADRTVEPPASEETRDMSTAPWRELREEMADHEEAIAAEREEVLREHIAYTLGELRAQHQVLRAEVAARLEDSELLTAQLDTIRAYIEALGGHLEISAVFDNERVPLDL